MKICAVPEQVALSIAFCCSLAAAQIPKPALSLPGGTAIPITFPHTLDAAKLKVGDAVITKTDQVILGPGGERIPRGSKLVGSVVDVQPPKTSTDPSELAIKFETLNVRAQAFPIHVALRAVASFVLSYSSTSPAADYGSLDSDLYRQVGGDYFFLYSVVYSNDWTEVGKSSRDGVFVKLQSVQLSNSRDHVVCDSTDTLQSVGVFASSACGVYGFPNLTVDASGADYSGAIRFRSTKRTVKIASGSSALLQVVGTKE
jgi:hypothetical protein